MKPKIPKKKDLNHQLEEIEIKKTALKKIMDEFNKKLKNSLNMKTLTLLISFLIGMNLNAQWTTETDVNTLVVETESGDMQAIGTSDGKTYVVFWKVVAAPTNYELRLQLLDADGNRQFGDEGMLISDAIPMSTYTMVWSIAVDASDNLYVGATSTIDYSGHVFKMDTGGNPLWGDDGITLGGEAFNITFLPMLSGDVLISWGTGNKASMQKYDADGNAVWASPQQVLSGTSKTWPGMMFELSDGGYEMIFHTYSFGISSTLWAQRYDGDGQAQWTSPTQLSNKTTAYINLYSAIHDEDTVFIGYKATANNRFDSYLQRINPDGTLPWGINGMDFDVAQEEFENDTRIAFAPGSQYIWSICSYSDANQAQYGEYVQKFDKTTGERQFTDNAKMIYDINDNMKMHAGPLQLLDGQPFFLLKVGFDNGGTPTTLNALLLDENGDFAWPEETLPMATYAANKSRITLTGPADGQVVSVFIEDKGAGNRIYAQNFVNGPALPAQPTLIAPEDGALELPLLVAFSWENAAGAETYNIQVAGDESFTSLIADESGITGTGFEFTLPGYETTYYWHVQSVNSTGNSDWSEAWSFTTLMDVPAQPVLASPANGAIDLPLEVTFEWETSLNADTYHLQIAEDDAFSTLIAEETGLETTSWDLTLPGYQTTYYWRVLAANATGNSEWSEAWSFTTQLATGIADSQSGSGFKVYPNPVTNAFSIGIQQEARGEIYTMAGRLVRSISPDEMQGQIDISDLGKGLYLVKILDVHGRIISSGKILKK